MHVSCAHSLNSFELHVSSVKATFHTHQALLHCPNAIAVINQVPLLTLMLQAVSDNIQCNPLLNHTSRKHSQIFTLEMLPFTSCHQVFFHRYFSIYPIIFQQSWLVKINNLNKTWSSMKWEKHEISITRQHQKQQHQGAPWHPGTFGALATNGSTSCSPNEPWLSRFPRDNTRATWECTLGCACKML